jgi:hypothetical protein
MDAEFVKCVGRIYRDRNSYPCDKRGTLEHDSKHWCKTHHPPTREARDAARDAKWCADLKAKQSRESQKLAQQLRDAADLARFRELAKRAVARLKVLREFNQAPADLEIELAAMAEEPTT